jgi:RNA polymerase sigma-70 factor (ECF subfamily)
LKPGDIPAEAPVPNLLRARANRTPTAEPEASRSDAELVALAMQDIRQFALLYARYLDPIYRYCYRRLGTRETAEDATSLIFTNALAAFPRFRDTSFRAWLFTIAHHVVTDRYRRDRREAPLDLEMELHDGAPSPEDQALAADERRRVLALLNRLPDHQRQIVELRLAGLTGTEIAQALGRSRANVDVSQYRAVVRLRALLGLTAESQEANHGTA